jgi:hypothetical protein
MSDPKELRINAQDCLKQVRVATSAQDKMLLLNMAHAWLRLSEQVEQLRASDGARPRRRPWKAETLFRNRNVRWTVRAPPRHPDLFTLRLSDGQKRPERSSSLGRRPRGCGGRAPRAGRGGRARDRGLERRPAGKSGKCSCDQAAVRASNVRRPQTGGRLPIQTIWWISR